MYKRGSIRYNTTQERDALAFCAQLMDYGVSLTITAALNELLNAYLMLRDRKKLFRHKIKMLANSADLKSMLLKSSMMSIMVNRKYFDDFSDSVIDSASVDILAFKKSIQQTFDEYGIEDSEFLAQCETARVMLKIAYEHYLMTIKNASQRYHCRIVYDFNEFNPHGVFITWDAVCEMLYEGHVDVNLNVDSNDKTFRKVVYGFTSGEYVDLCIKEADRLNPEYVKERESLRIKDEELEETKK